MRKVLTFIVTIGLLISILPVSGVAAATEFSDVANHWAKSGIHNAVEKGYVSGYPDGNFQPNNQVTRAEFIKMIVDDLGLTHGIDNKVWYQPYVDAAVNNGIHAVIDFNDYTKPISRLEITRLISRALIRNDAYKAYYDSFKGLYNGDLPFVDYRDIKQQDVPYLALVFGTKIIAGYPDLSFGMDKNATRAEAAVMLHNFDKTILKNPNTFQYLNEMKEITEFGTNAESVSKMRHDFETDLLTDVVVDHPKFKAVLKRLYAIPLHNNVSMYERKYISDRSFIEPTIFNENETIVITVINFTPKVDGSVDLYLNNLLPNNTYVHYKDKAAHENFKLNNWYMEGRYKFKKDVPVELSFYSVLSEKEYGLDLQYTMNGKRLSFPLIRNPLN